MILSAASAAELGWAAETSKQRLLAAQTVQAPRTRPGHPAHRPTSQALALLSPRARARALARPRSHPSALHFPPMTLFDSLGPTVAAELSSMRDAVPRHLLLGKDAEHEFARELRAECAGAAAPRAVVLFDARTRAAAGERCVGRAARRGLRRARAARRRWTARRSGLRRRDRAARSRARLPATDLIVGRRQPA